MVTFNKSLLNDMESFDLLCVNADSLADKSSRIFQKICTGNGKWGHVGIVVKNDIIPNIKNKVYIWDCSNVFKGVGLYELEFFCELHDLNINKIGWCKLKNNPLHRNSNDTDESYNKRIKEIKKKINSFYIRTKNSTFHYYGTVKLVLPFLQKVSLHDEVKPYQQDLNIKKSYFCSEFAAIIYKIINVVDKNIEPESIFPIKLINYKDDNGKIFNNPITIFIKQDD